MNLRAAHGHCSPVGSPSATLIDACRQGDPDARTALFEQVAPRVLTWCTLMGGPRVDPEDASHDVLITVMTRLEKLQDPSRFDAWMFGITRRVLAAHRRTAWLRRWLPGLVPDVADPGDTPAVRAERAAEMAVVHEVLEALAPELREILVLSDLEERSEREVAEMLDIPVGTVKSRLFRARERFERAARRQLGEAATPSLPAGGTR